MFSTKSTAEAVSRKQMSQFNTFFDFILHSAEKQVAAWHFY